MFNILSQLNQVFVVTGICKRASADHQETAAVFRRFFEQVMTKTHSELLVCKYSDSWQLFVALTCFPDDSSVFSLLLIFHNHNKHHISSHNSSRSSHISRSLPLLKDKRSTLLLVSFICAWQDNVWGFTATNWTVSIDGEHNKQTTQINT